ncbi:hypothetical protein EVJ58_g10173 [Rhodofomes roseus]|uniref:Uncharacterized protein n=1 Tax=Rhodofomes roseus TaxID=34475 RepID=A0A4Y9XQU4_9APHY|nr:hypothetical protein EVJ58_g10173 [Rhodofomes roseus]
MSFNFNVFGAVTGGLGFLLAILQYLLFVTFRPSRVLRALEESLDSLQNVLVDVQRDGIPDDDFSLGWAGAQTRLDRTRTRMLRCEVNSLASVTSEINAIMCGLTCKLFSLRRKTYSLLAEVAVAELFERQRQEDHMLDNQFSNTRGWLFFGHELNIKRKCYCGNVSNSSGSALVYSNDMYCSAADEAAPIAHTRHKNKPIGVLHLDQGLSTRVAIGVSTGHNESTEMGVRSTSSGESVPRRDDVPEDSSPLASGSSQNSMFLPGDAATASIEASPSEPQHVFTDSM